MQLFYYLNLTQQKLFNLLQRCENVEILIIKNIDVLKKNIQCQYCIFQ